MRIFYAWLLLSISAFQWIGGYVCFEVSYFIEVQRQMSETEQLIADGVKEETGVETSVKILHDEQFGQRGIIYSNFFAFSHDIDEETVYFTLEETGTVDYEQVTRHQQPRGGDEEKAAHLKSLHQDFTVPVNSFPIATTGAVPATNFQIKGYLPNPDLSTLSPPPDVA